MSRKILGLCLSAAAALTLVVAACSAPAAPAPTAAPAKPAEATKAPAAAAAPTAAPAAPTAAAAPKATFPEKGKTITFIIPYSAGGATDMGGRLLCATLEKVLGVPVQVLNKPGAGSQTGLTELAKSKPDGYTIGFANVPTANLIYMDPERKAAFGSKDFAPIGVHVVDVSAIGVSASGPYKTMKDLVDTGKAKPESIKFGSDGPMTDDALGIFILETQTGAKFANVAFDSGGAAMTSLLGGHIDASFGHVGDFISNVKSGNARVLGVADTQRSKFYPDVPTFKESGFDLINASSRMVVAPAGTPKDVIDTLSAAMKKAMEDPDAMKKLDDAGLLGRYMDVAQSQALMQDAEAKAKALVEQTRKP